MVEHTFTFWPDFFAHLTKVNMDFRNHWKSPKSAVAFFRGHSNSEYSLIPGLYRSNINPGNEGNYFYEYQANAGSLLPRAADSWEILFSMQHHGIPSRILDWSESFAVALYFALYNFIDGKEIDTRAIDVWMLDPYELNGKDYKEDIIDVHDDFDVSYIDFCINRRKNIIWNKGALAIYPARSNPRIIAQQGAFTIHESNKPIEQMQLDRLYRFTLAGDSILDEAKNYLRFSGVNTFTIKPDLDGLANYIKNRFELQASHDTNSDPLQTIKSTESPDNVT